MVFSLITATYNAAGHLQHCLASITAQTLPCEHILVDGGSTDGTALIVDEYLDRWGQAPDGACPRVRFLSEPDRGIYDALNKGVGMATGDIIGILHADDFYPSPDILARVSKVFEDPAVEACYGDLLYVSDGNNNSKVTIQNSKFDIVRYWQSGPFSPDRFRWGWMPPHPTLFVRRAVYERHGLFRLDLGTAADYELMLRFLLKQRIRCAYLPEVLVCMRVGGASNRSLKARLKANRMDCRAWAVNGLRPYPWTVALKPLRKVSQWWQRP